MSQQKVPSIAYNRFIPNLGNKSPDQFETSEFTYFENVWWPDVTSLYLIITCA